MTALLVQILDWLTPRAALRRYRIMPDRKASAFRRETLARVIHALKRDAPRPK
jgi:hypothetical protein